MSGGVTRVPGSQAVAHSTGARAAARAPQGLSSAVAFMRAAAPHDRVIPPHALSAAQRLCSQQMPPLLAAALRSAGAQALLARGASAQAPLRGASQASAAAAARCVTALAGSLVNCSSHASAQAVQRTTGSAIIKGADQGGQRLVAAAHRQGGGVSDVLHSAMAPPPPACALIMEAACVLPVWLRRAQPGAPSLAVLGLQQQWSVQQQQQQQQQPCLAALHSLAATSAATGQAGTAMPLAASASLLHLARSLFTTAALGEKLARPCHPLAAQLPIRSPRSPVTPSLVPCPSHTRARRRRGGLLAAGAGGRALVFLLSRAMT